MDLSKYESTKLQQIKKDIDVELKRRRKQDVKEAQKEVKNVAERYGLTVQDLMPGVAAKAGKPASKVRFRHPDDPSKGWSGRGRKPGWVRAWEEAGRSLDDIRVG